MDHAQFRACPLSRIRISLIWSSDPLTFIRNNSAMFYVTFLQEKKRSLSFWVKYFIPIMERLFFFPLLCSSVESTQWPGMKTTSHEVDKRERADETSFTDEIFTMEEVRNSTEILPCLHSMPFFFFFEVAQGHLLSAVSPLPPLQIYAISEREVITHGCGGMFFILSSLPASLLEIALLFSQSACWGRPVWQTKERREEPRRVQSGCDPYFLFFLHFCN